MIIVSARRSVVLVAAAALALTSACHKEEYRALLKGELPAADAKKAIAAAVLVQDDLPTYRMAKAPAQQLEEADKAFFDCLGVKPDKDKEHLLEENHGHTFTVSNGVVIQSAARVYETIEDGNHFFKKLDGKGDKCLKEQLKADPETKAAADHLVTKKSSYDGVGGDGNVVLDAVHAEHGVWAQRTVAAAVGPVVIELNAVAVNGNLPSHETMEALLKTLIHRTEEALPKNHRHYPHH